MQRFSLPSAYSLKDADSLSANVALQAIPPSSYKFSSFSLSTDLGNSSHSAVAAEPESLPMPKEEDDDASMDQREDSVATTDLSALPPAASPSLTQPQSASPVALVSAESSEETQDIIWLESSDEFKEACANALANLPDVEVKQSKAKSILKNLKTTDGKSLLINTAYPGKPEKLEFGFPFTFHFFDQKVKTLSPTQVHLRVEIENLNKINTRRRIKIAICDWNDSNKKCLVLHIDREGIMFVEPIGVNTYCNQVDVDALVKLFSELKPAKIKPLYTWKPEESTSESQPVSDEEVSRTRKGRGKKRPLQDEQVSRAKKPTTAGIISSIKDEVCKKRTATMAELTELCESVSGKPIDQGIALIAQSPHFDSKSIEVKLDAHQFRGPSVAPGMKGHSYKTKELSASFKFPNSGGVDHDLAVTMTPTNHFRYPEKYNPSHGPDHSRYSWYQNPVFNEKGGTYVDIRVYQTPFVKPNKDEVGRVVVANSTSGDSSAELHTIQAGKPIAKPRGKPKLQTGEPARIPISGSDAIKVSLMFAGMFAPVTSIFDSAKWGEVPVSLILTLVYGQAYYERYAGAQLVEGEINTAHNGKLNQSSKVRAQYADDLQNYTLEAWYYAFAELKKEAKAQANELLILAETYFPESFPKEPQKSAKRAKVTDNPLAGKNLTIQALAVKVYEKSQALRKAGATGPSPDLVKLSRLLCFGIHLDTDQAKAESDGSFSFYSKPLSPADAPQKIDYIKMRVHGLIYEHGLILEARRKPVVVKDEKAQPAVVARASM